MHFKAQQLSLKFFYQVTATTRKTTTESYIRLAFVNYKQRNHKTSFRHNNRENETEPYKNTYTVDPKDAYKPSYM